MGKHLARVDGVIGDTEAEIYFYHTDHIGSVRAVTNQEGEVVWNADYLAFGRRFGDDGASEFEEWHGFTGKEYDPDTGLYYYNARWYDADIGRFISEDPAADPNNPNLYVYGRNNPLRFVDPTGLTTVADIGVTPGSTGASQETLSTTHVDGGGQNTTVTYGRGGSRTYTEHDNHGNPTRQMTFNRDGSFDSTTIFGNDGSKTSWAYDYSEDGMLITQKKQEKGFLGLGWKTVGFSIMGYDDTGLGFVVDKNGNVKAYNKQINGDLLNRACTGYLDFYREMYGLARTRYKWYTLVRGRRAWDFKTQMKTEEGYSFMYRNRIWTPEQFGNISYGYTGKHLGFSFHLLLSGSVYAVPNEALDGKVKTFEDKYREDISEDWGMIGYGYGINTRDFNSHVMETWHMKGENLYQDKFILGLHALIGW